MLQHQPDQFGGPVMRARSAALPTKSRPLSRSTVQAEAGFERRDRLVHVLPVEVHAGFEAQRVARAEARRGHAGVARACHSAAACAAGTTISNPSSPV